MISTTSDAQGPRIFDKVDKNFPFASLGLTSPVATPGGGASKLFSTMLMTDTRTPLYVQTPRCKFQKSPSKGSKKWHADLLISHQNEDFIEWLEELERRCQDLIFERRKQWFTVELTRDDIESTFETPFKVIKSGKFYVLRIGFEVPKGATTPTLLVYDENDHSYLLSDITPEQELICILEITGIRCDASSFALDMEAKQILLTQPAVNFFQRKLIGNPGAATTTTTPPTHPHDGSMTPLAPAPAPASAPSLSLSSSTKSSHAVVQGPSSQEQVVVAAAAAAAVKETPETKKEEATPGESQSSAGGSGEAKEEEMMEVDFEFDALSKDPGAPVKLVERKEVYYEMYRQACRKAKLAKSLALSSFLEAQRIKNLYMLHDLPEDLDEGQDDMDLTTLDLYSHSVPGSDTAANKSITSTSTIMNPNKTQDNGAATLSNEEEENVEDNEDDEDDGDDEDDEDDEDDKEDENEEEEDDGEEEEK